MDIVFKRTSDHLDSIEERTWAAHLSLQDISRRLDILERNREMQRKAQKILSFLQAKRYLYEYDIRIRRGDIFLQNTFSRVPRIPRILHLKEHHKILLKFLPEAIIWDHIYPFQKRIILITRGVGEEYSS